MVKIASILILFAALLGGPIFLSPPLPSYMASAQTSTSNPTVSPTPEEKLKKLNILMGEHAFLGGQMLIARYERKADYDEALEALNTNSKEILLLVGDFYGQEAEDDLTTVWNRHINAFINYTDAKRDNDRNRQSQAVRELQRFTEDAANILSRGNRDLFATAQNYLAQHIVGEKRIIDMYAEGSYTEMYKAMHDAYLHSTMMTDKLR